MLEKSAHDQKTHASERWTGLLRQATWLAGILAAAWIITTIIKAFT